MKKYGKKLMAVLCSAGVLGGMQTVPVMAETEFTYQDVSDLEFSFCSGAGAWGTVLTIDENGAFAGTYHDSDMGDTGDDYPAGTVYLCDFSGQFTEPLKVNSYTYSVEIESIEYEKEMDTSEIIDGVRYIYSEPYELDGADRILFYLQGAPLAELPEEYLSWVGYYDLAAAKETELPFTGLYNEAAQEGFSSYENPDRSAETGTSAIDKELEEIAARAADMETELESGLLSQLEMNRLSGELYMLWDDELNSMWKRIREILPEDAMAQLTAEELDWIREKEAAVEEAGAEAEGGSLQPLLKNDAAAMYTRERVYELAKYLR